MIRPLLGWLISLAQRLVDDTIPEKQLHLYIRESLEGLAGLIHRGQIPKDDEALSFIDRAANRLHALGLDGLPVLPSEPSPNRGADPGGEDQRPGSVVHKGMIVREPLRLLLRAVHQDRPLGESQKNDLEALLRHIEVRRQEALRFTDAPTEHERWYSAAQTSVLFSRYAMRTGDYRFLNTALKLNDWAYRYFRKRGVQQENLIYLQALLEAEAGLMEMVA